MVNQKLLQKELAWYSQKVNPVEIKPTQFNQKILPRLLEKFPYYGMTEHKYCCYGEKCCCWEEIIEEGIWSLTLDNVKYYIERNIEKMKKYLYNTKKYGKRFFMYEDDESCFIYVYGRDIIKKDFSIWFNKTGEN